MSTAVDFQEFLKTVEPDSHGFRGKLLLWIIVAFLVTAFTWASITEIAEVTRGQGKVIPSLQVQQIQSLDGGIVEKILVRKGQIVEEGEVLLELDPTSSMSSYNQAMQKRYALMAELARLLAEADGTELTFSKEVEVAAAPVVAAQRRLYQARKAELASELAVLKQQLLQRKQELNEAQNTLAAAKESRRLLASEIDLIEPLVKRGIESDVTLLQLQREHSDLEGQENGAALKIKRLKTAIEEAEQKQTSALHQFRSDALDRASEVASELSELEKTLPAYKDKLLRTDIRSPVRGIVNRVLVTTIGGVASPGKPLIEIVPLDDDLVIEANIAPADIAFLHPGQPVKVKLTAYDFARYGALDGTLTTIGADAVQDPETQETFYPVQVHVESRLRDAAGQELDIVPGMVAEIDVLTGTRTILDYITEPVIKMKETAFREK